MGYNFLETHEGLFTVDVDLIGRILDDYAYATSLNDNANSKSISQKGINPFSWGMPDMHTVEVDWNKAAHQRKVLRARLEYQYQEDINRHFMNARLKESHQSTKPLSAIRNTLAGLEMDAHRYKLAFRNKQTHAQRRTVANIQDSVGKYEGAKKIAEFTRDLSATSLMVGATVLSGGGAVLASGQALTALSLGSTVKGVGKYAETGNFGKGIMEFTVNFALGIIPGPPATASRKEQIALLVVVTKLDIGANTAVGLMDGKSLGHALTSATIDATLGKVLENTTGNLFRMEALTRKISNLTLPGTLQILTKAGSDTLGKYGRDKAVDAVFSKPQPKQLLSRSVLVGEPSIADVAILGPDKSSAPRLIPLHRKNVPDARRAPGLQR